MPLPALDSAQGDAAVQGDTAARGRTRHRVGREDRQSRTAQELVEQAQQLAATLAAVGAAPDLDGALAALARGAIALLRGSGGAVRLYQVGIDRHDLAYWVGPDGSLEPARQVIPAPGSVAAALRDGGPSQLIDDLERQPFHVTPQAEERRQRGMRASVAVPIESGGKRLGSLHVDHREPGRFAAADLALAEAVASQAGAVIERARMEARRRELAERLTATLAEIGAAPDLPAAAAALLEGALALLHAERAAVRIFAPPTGGTHLSLFLQRGGSIEPGPHRPAPLPGSINAAIMNGGAAVLVDDLWQLDPQDYPLAEQSKRLGVRSAVHVPIDSGGQRIGSLAVHHGLPGFFGHLELALAEALATHAGGVIQRAQLETARRQAEAQQARLDGALLVARTAAHDVNNALSPVTGYADLLNMRPSVAEDPLAMLYVQQITAAAQEVSDKIRRLQRIIRLEEVQSPLGPQQPVLDLARSTADPA